MFLFYWIHCWNQFKRVIQAQPSRSHERITTSIILDGFKLPQFGPDVITPRVMQRLLRHGVLVHLPKKKPKSVNPIIFSQSQAHEGFVMILEGRAQIVIGPDNLKCETGPFSYFGVGVLDDNLDDTLHYGYTVEAVGEVRYLKIPRELYQAAVEASRIERTGYGIVPPQYRNLLADEDDRDLGESTKTTLVGSSKPPESKDPSAELKKMAGVPKKKVEADPKRRGSRSKSSGEAEGNEDGKGKARGSRAGSQEEKHSKNDRTERETRSRSANGKRSPGETRPSPLNDQPQTSKQVTQQPQQRSENSEEPKERSKTKSQSDKTSDSSKSANSASQNTKRSSSNDQDDSSGTSNEPQH